MAAELRERKRLRAELESVMGRRGLRSTSQRRLILDRLFEIGEHFTADDLIADVRQALGAGRKRVLDSFVEPA